MRSTIWIGTTVLLSALVGCGDLTGNQQLPAGTVDPATFKTPAGALGMRNTVLVTLEKTMPSFIVTTGLLTDELEVNTMGASPGVLSTNGTSSSLADNTQLDERILVDPHLSTLSSGGSTDYGNLQQVRRDVRQAIGALVAYSPTSPRSMRGELYAIMGYAEIMLGDLFCSGVPLSIWEFEGDFTYKAGSTTSQVYQDAIAQFDTALVLSADSSFLMTFAHVGRARALLALGRYTEAATEVASVPDGFQYKIPVQWTTSTSGLNVLTTVGSVADHDGGTGLPYRSSNDPRTGAGPLGTNRYHATLYFPTKYTATNVAFVPIATAVEARLIEAEVALHNRDITTWLAKLNHVRTNGTFTTAPRANPKTHADSVAIDTLWNAGTGNIAGLKPLADPGTDTARITLLFNERAAWLFLTGQRQGDLRRLIRQYGRRQDAVYPSGPFLKPGLGIYGSDINAPVPKTEDPNPLFTGCFNRDA